ncbi:Subtilase family protein [bacterium A37T11]|nr:Subtilase family protein [bacterium A37T11]
MTLALYLLAVNNLLVFMRSILLLLIYSTLFSYSGFSQGKKDKPKVNWFNLDLKEDSVMGISTEKAYRELLPGKKGVPVIVAVIDGGTDINHEDLKNAIWVNPDDRVISPDDTTDADHNGYPGDVHGWNFIGNKNGNDVHFDNLEVTRQLKVLRPLYMSVLPSTPLPEKQRREFLAFQKMTADYTDKLERAQLGQLTYNRIKKVVDTMLSQLKNPKPELKMIEDYKVSDQMDSRALKLFRSDVKDQGFEEAYKDLKEGVEYFNNQVNYHLNMGFNSRDTVGDNYENSNERFYGNADVMGPDAKHGTHVAGIIGANRNNNIGIKGVADQVQLMIVRTVPDGDERDKDVANAIRYAVENGAKVISMSFGKAYVKDKRIVDDAVRFAREKDVLLVHAAGNDAQDNDKHPNFPNRNLVDSLGINQGTVDNWIEVGASGWKNDDNLVAEFSNYGRRSVDVFAPGVQLYSTLPGNTYDYEDGTSMAAPVVSGLAALIRSYYPNLKASEVKEIILKSVTKVDQKVKIRGDDGNRMKVNLSDISVSGGVVNAYQALKMAAEKKESLKK